MATPYPEQRHWRSTIWAILPYRGNKGIWISYQENQVIQICTPCRLYQSQLRTMYSIYMYNYTHYDVWDKIACPFQKLIHGSSTNASDFKITVDNQKQFHAENGNGRNFRIHSFRYINNVRHENIV